MPPRVDHAAHEAAVRTRRAARQAADFSRPRVEHAVAVAGPVREEAAARGAAALAALRGQVTPEQIGQLARRNERRARAGRLAKRLAVLGVLAAGAVAVWKWWDKQANPDWLVEPPAATEVPDRAPLTSVDGSAQASLDPEVQARDTAYHYYGGVVEGEEEFLPDALANDPSIYPTEDVISKLEFAQANPDWLRLRNEAWTKFKAA